MGLIRLLFLFFFLLCYSNQIWAGEGCLIGNKVYYNQTGTVTFIGLGARYLYDPVTSYDDFVSCTDMNTYAQRTSQPTQGLFGSTIMCGFTGDTYLNAGKGYVWDFNEVYCPIDDYVWLLFAAISIAGIPALRKKYLHN